MHRSALACFLFVGCAAAALHWGVAVTLVSAGGWPPLAANAAGWLPAFVLSLLGHHRLSFRGHGVRLSTAARRHFLVSAAGFVVNECAYAVLLRWRPAHYGLALAGVLIVMAVITYLLSRRWTFLRAPAA